MINEKLVKKYCKEDISKIKNYDKAISDTTKMWDCHHMTETWWNCTAQVLIDNECYYGRKACELIFLTREEHSRLHMKGKKLSEETCRKLSEAFKGEHNPLFGKHHSGETCKKIGEAHKGKHLSEETRRKLSEASKGKTPFKGHFHSEETKKKLSAARKGMTWKLINGKRVYFPKEVK